MTLSPAFGRDSIGFATGQTEGSPYTSFDASQETLSYRMRVNGRLNKKMVLDAGIDLESRVTHYDFTIPFTDDVAGPVAGEIDVPPEQTQRNIDMLSYGVHVDVGWDVSDKLRLVPGLRFDGYLLSGEPRYLADGRLVGRYQIDRHWLAKAYVGSFHQPSQPEAYDSDFGNPDLKLERAYHFGLGGEWKPTKLWTIDAEAYFVDRFDLAEFTSQTEVDDATGQVRPLNFLNTEVSDTLGFEVLIKREVTDNMFGWLSYTLSRSMERREPEEIDRPTAFDQRHTLNAVLSYSLDSGWEFGGRYQLATGRPITPVIGSTFDADSGSYRPVQGPSRSGRRPAYNKFDVRVEKTWLLKTWSGSTPAARRAASGSR